MSRIKSFYHAHRELILYFSFGIITTVLSLLACYLTLKIGVIFMYDENGEPTELLDILGSTAQWIVGVLVAFITNKKWVFINAAKGVRATFKQLLTFSSSRILTYILEALTNLGAIALLETLGYSPFTILGISFTSRIWAKAFSSVLVVVSNYFISKLIVFRKLN